MRRTVTQVGLGVHLIAFVVIAPALVASTHLQTVAIVLPLLPAQVAVSPEKRKLQLRKRGGQKIQRD